MKRASRPKASAGRCKLRLSRATYRRRNRCRSPSAGADSSVHLRRQLLLISLLTISGCYWNYPKRQKLSDGRVIPLEWSKAVEPLGVAKATRYLRYDVLYVADANDLPRDRRGEWYRFWPDGRVMGRSTWSFEPARPEDDVTGPNADSF